MLNAFRHHGERDFTPAPPDACWPWVLNAFRHHGERDDNLPRGAQLLFVLNAFRHHGERDFQRAAPPVRRGVCVLNAFRHHGERDEVAAMRGGLERIVLNAFRHHGERDNYEVLTERQKQWCSTPSGITASGTLQCCRKQHHRQGVLNAFRHHGERDPCRCP